MELRHLRYFVAVADALSFTKGAERLHVAQPSLTRQIKDLEAEIGVQLFDRSGKRISLTREGESFLADAKRLLAECAQSVQTVQRLSRGEASQTEHRLCRKYLPRPVARYVGGISEGMSSHSAKSVRHDTWRAIPRPR